MEFETSVRELVAALSSRPVQDVPIWFTYTPTLYGERNISRLVCFRINGVNYFYVHDTQPSIDQVLAVLPLVEPLRGQLVPNVFTGEEQKCTVEIGYYDYFSTFVSVSSLLKPSTDQLVPADTPFQVTGLSDIMSKMDMDIRTRHLLSLATKQPVVKLPKDDDGKIEIPTTPESNPDPVNQKVWRMLRERAEKYMLGHVVLSSDALSIDTILDQLYDGVELTLELTDPNVNPEIIARLLQFGYSVKLDQFDPAVREPLALTVMYILNNTTPIELGSNMRNRIYNWLGGWNNRVYQAPKEYTNLVTMNNPKAEYYQRSGYYHHDSTYNLGKQVHHGAVDVEIIFRRYPHPDPSMLPRFNFDYADVKKVVESGITPGFPSGKTQYFQQLMYDSEVSPNAKATLLYKASITRFEFHRLTLDNFPNYESVVRSLNRRDQSSMDSEFKRMDDHKKFLQSYVGLHPVIDTTIQHILCLFYGTDVSKLFAIKCLIVSPLLVKDFKIANPFVQIDELPSFNQFLKPERDVRYISKEMLNTKGVATLVNVKETKRINRWGQREFKGKYTSMPRYFMDKLPIMAEPYMLSELIDGTGYITTSYY